MTLKQLKAFVAVARTLSFVEAGTLVHLSQPALSLAVKNLEESLGGRLFQRSTRQVSLTPEGRAFFPLARRILSDWEHAEDEMRQRFSLGRGRVALAAMPTFAGNLLPGVLADFRRQFPEITIEVNDVIAEEVVERVTDGRVELGICFDPGVREDLVFESLFEDRYIAIIPEGHALLQGAPETIHWDQLLEEDFITLQRPSGVRHMLERRLAEAGLKLTVAFETHQLVTCGRMVAEGLGVSAVPAMSADQMSALGCRCLGLEGPVIEQRVGVIRRGRHELSVAVQAMLDTLRARYPVSPPPVPDEDLA
ncbi:LysR substrate-binding domain-containing protein [Cobetia marina]|jgi:LysR family carnitine catabolism transcriptional activator|uniref:LysR family transcriptional regulator n=1 Tax=Cobetia TaxID=204286 RepID=UPI001141D459|nr:MULTISPECIES: LysR family transcriptional regulator [Cobetia]MDI6002225.1 LysR substrate-binding domain-containing protein [Cobetia pacifica]MDO6789186.1 LysR substrate-binding domain-containing protein [Cobetia marina]GED42993.1 transcriptional regulator [Cobetia marina]